MWAHLSYVLHFNVADEKGRMPDVPLVIIRFQLQIQQYKETELEKRISVHKFVRFQYRLSLGLRGV